MARQWHASARPCRGARHGRVGLAMRHLEHADRGEQDGGRQAVAKQLD